MARNYDGESSSSVRDEIAQERMQQAAMHKKIELGLIIGAFAIGGLSVVLNAGKCVSYAGRTSEYINAKLEQEAVLEDLNAKLQDPAAQNYEYKDPTVGNMAEIGQAMALEQNKMIRSYQMVNNMTGLQPSQPQVQVQTVPEDTQEGTSADPGHQAAPAESSGAVTLDPSDMAPASSGTPDTDDVETSEGVTLNPDSGAEDATDGSGYEYTLISDFNQSPAATPDGVAGTGQSTGVDQTAIQNVTGTELATLIRDFKQNYYAAIVTNVDRGDVLWSWYGNWEFSGTYDYSVNEIPDMKAVWTCYDVSDTAHLRPLAFVKANYSQSTQKFTNLEAVYTQAYVKQADSQAASWGSASDAAPSDGQQAGQGSGNGASLSPDGGTLNGEGSENEFVPNITEDTVDMTDDTGDTDGTGAVTITPEDDTPSNGTTPSGNTSSGSGQGNTAPASNPPGQAPWSSGPGAGTSGSGGSGSGTWTPGGGSSANPDGTWTPGNGASGGSSNAGGSPENGWTPSTK